MIRREAWYREAALQWQWIHLPDYWSGVKLLEVMEYMLEHGSPEIRILVRDGEWYALEGSHRVAAVEHLHRWWRRMHMYPSPHLPVAGPVMQRLQEIPSEDQLPVVTPLMVQESTRIEDPDLLQGSRPMAAGELWEALYRDPTGARVKAPIEER